MWGMRVVIPQKYQSKVLDEFHGEHLGTVKMKALGRAHVWWPSIGKDIEQTTQRCSGCQRMKHDPKLTPTHPWEYPEGPWRREHIDFAGPVEGKQDVFSSGGCLLQMARGDGDVKYNYTGYLRPVAQCICKVGDSTTISI